MNKLRVAVSGLGNLGKYAIEALEYSPDMECIGVLRRKSSIGTKPFDLLGQREFSDIESLIKEVGKPDVIIVCQPSKSVPAEVKRYLELGINTVDSFDIHSEIAQTVEMLTPIALANGVSAVISAGWDPGTDSALRVYFEAMAPMGTTFTNFGRGRSMGHSVVAKSVEGVADAVSITIPIGGGKHSRLVYVLLQPGYTASQAEQNIKKDDYFAHDPLHVVAVDSEYELNNVVDNSHGVLIERIGGYGSVSNQHLKFDMRINNPALTSQIMVSCARATARLGAGAYTIIDIPPVALLPGERINNIRRLV